MLDYIRYGVMISCIVSLVSLSILVVRTFRFGKKRLYAQAAGNTTRGIVYAFGKGMLPWEKESARNHLPSYLGGIAYHAGIFSAILYLVAVVFSIALPYPVLLFFRVMSLAGFLAGFALLLKRLLSLHMRQLSCPDDVVANVVVDVFLGFSFLHTLMLTPAVTMYFFIASIIMFLYMPLGKIRHCFFFFFVRILFGTFYGRRGVFGVQAPKH